MLEKLCVLFIQVCLFCVSLVCFIGVYDCPYLVLKILFLALGFLVLAIMAGVHLLIKEFKS